MAKKTNGKDPAVLLYTQDFIVGTLTMTNEQRGKYIMLLCLQHQKGKLTETDLRQYLNEEDIVVAEKFTISSDGFYYNDRMQMEIENRKVFTDSRRNNGSKGGRPTKVAIEETKEEPYGFHKDKLNVTYLKARYNHTEDENENEAVADYINDSEYDNVNVSINNNSKPNYKKVISGLLQIENKALFHNSWEDMEEIGFDVIAENNEWNESIYNNYVERINNNYIIINQSG